MFFPLFLPIPIPIPFYSRGRSYICQTYQNPQYQFYQYEPMKTNVMIGKLPDSFLRVPETSEASTQEERDRAAAIHLQNQMIAEARQPLVGRLEITFVNAVLNKNYGISRMDPYVHMRIGHHVYETHTANNGAKIPYWNKTFQIYNLHPSITSMQVQIFDERTLTEDELIASCDVPIKEQLRKGELVDEWYKLSGKLGEGQEGTIHMVMSYSTGPPPPPAPLVLPGYGSGYAAVPVYSMPSQVARPTHTAQPVVVQEDDVKQLVEMFPEMEETAIRSVLEASRANKEVAANTLLRMQQ